jgi:hypothetical protein
MGIWDFGAAQRKPAGMAARVILGFGVLFGALLFGATTASAACTAAGFLSQPTTAGDPLVVSTACRVKPGTYTYGPVNIIAGGQLIFDEGDGPGNIDFWASSIIIENKGALMAQNSKARTKTAPNGRFGASGSVLTIHLWGANASLWDDKNQKFISQNKGALCKTTQDKNNGPCGTPTDGSGNPINGQSISLPSGITDNFYQYGPLYGDGACSDGSTYSPTSGSCSGGGQVGYFGNKVLAVSYGGTLQLTGYKGTSDTAPADDSTNSGYSWMRLNDGSSLEANATSLTLEDDPGGRWAAGDEIVVTTTDYLPGHSEKLEIGSVSGQTVNFSASPKNPCPTNSDRTTEQASPLCSVKKIHWPHNGVRYGGPKDTGHKALSDRLQPRLKNSIDSDLVNNGVETRAAVALLSRSIRIVSEGDTLGQPFPDPTVKARCLYDPIGAAANCQYTYGGHMVVRQGFQAVQISGVEFKQMGQGGRIGHYPVHFHMARQTPANTYIVDSSVNESMTRWYVIHSTLGVTLARNVGYLSIGHGYYLEMGPETDNKFYSNIGILARGAVDNAQNPRKVPGILAYKYDLPPAPAYQGMPYRSDSENPTVFWITNGWNDFIGNMAAGATTCGAGYWLVPAGNTDYADVGGAPMNWTGYASLQQNNGTWAGTAPLKLFYKNYATSSMQSFQTTAQSVGECRDLGVYPYGFTPSTAGAPVLLEVHSAAPKPTPDNSLDHYYPHSLAGSHRETHCPSDTKGGYDCSKFLIAGAKPCDNSAEDPCGVTVLDHFTSSFHWAMGNGAAIWLRPLWYLMDNSVLSDVQQGGFTFVSGGDYTHSSAITGYWALARNSIFIGNTQNGNPFASNTGPFHADSTNGVTCDPLASGVGAQSYCLNSAQGVTMYVGGLFTNQRLDNIYDGPSHQDSNAYLDIKAADCAPIGNTNTGECMYGGATSSLLLKKTPNSTQGPGGSTCYLPNAAIAWKQPNGFYYPPAFHSANLQFDNVDIRHFVIEPLFQASVAGATCGQTCGPNKDQPCKICGPNKDQLCTCDFGQGGTYLGDSKRIDMQYCTHSNYGVFDSFNSIDRQTELNDDDGSLTGLVNVNPTPTVTNPKLPPEVTQTISVNEDNYFEAPVETPECASNIGANALPQNTTCPTTNASLPPPTVKTSPYDYVTTAVWPRTVPQTGIPYAGDATWYGTCANQACYGVPLYRQYLTGKDGGSAEASTGEWVHWYANGCYNNSTTPQCRWPFIRMAGTGSLQRETMTTNNGLYYIDTSLPLSEQQKENFHNGGAPLVYNAFLPTNQYTVFLVYAKATTKQTYQIYVGSGFTSANFTPTRVDIDTFPLTWVDQPGGAWATVKTVDGTPTGAPIFVAPGVVEVTIDLSGAPDITPSPAQGLCQPHDFCASSDGKSCVSNLQPNDPRLLANPKLAAEATYICQNWAMKDLDCPAAGCYGFSFTLPSSSGFVADGKAYTATHRPPPGPFPETADSSQGAPYWNTKFSNTTTPPDDASGPKAQCYYQTLPYCPFGD